jgi:hypothetical protein
MTTLYHYEPSLGQVANVNDRINKTCVTLVNTDFEVILRY